MDFQNWTIAVGAVLAGNFFTGMFCYFIYQVTRAANEGRDDWRLPLRVYFAAIVPLLIVIFALYSVKPA